MIVYVENPSRKIATKKPMQLTSESGKVRGHKANIQKSPACPYASNEHLEFDIQNIPLK